jgi:hypothetical protein
VHAAPVGDFTYRKVMRQGYVVPSQVFVFALWVCETRDTWPEKDVRKRRWITLIQAAGLAGDRGLARFMRGIAETDGAALRSVLAKMEAGGAPAREPATS